MAEVVRVLIVEDDDAQFDTYTDAADDMSTEALKIVLTRKRSAAEAQEVLRSGSFDGALIDLNLNSENAEDAEGNEVIEQIIGLHRFPVFVVSGNLGKLKEDIRKRESDFLVCFDRTVSNEEIFNKLLGIYATGITHILGGRGELERKIGEIFWAHLANDLGNWISLGHEVRTALLRYTVAHLTEYLDEPTESGDYYNPAEFYIKPPIRRVIATGDVAKNGPDHYIVLSPACDVAVRNADLDNPVINASRITLAKVIPVTRQDFLSAGIIKEGDSASNREKVLEKIVKGQSEKYVFIPRYKDLPAGVIDLQNIYSVGFPAYRADYQRVATIAGPFLKDIQSRFSAYYGRQGQPDLDKKEMVKTHKAALSPVE